MRVGSSRDGLTGSWEDALEKDGVIVHPAYSQYFPYENKLDRRPAAVKRDWWKGILTQVEANGGVVTVIMNERLTRYTQSARSTEARKGAVVEDVNAPILPDDGGEAAPARKKKRQPVAVLAERASGRFVRRICGR